MKVFVTGGTGLIGRALVKGMLSDGYEVTVLTRQSLESWETSVRTAFLTYLGL